MTGFAAEPTRSGGTGFTIGHWTDPDARTGCTVVLFDHPALAAVDVRGAAPGTRETDLLRDEQLVRRADAILLGGGSAFGLAAADGVVRYLAERGRGFPTIAGPVPVVPAAIIYDLRVGRPVAPGVNAGHAACLAARGPWEVTRGLVGAGTGATTGKLIAGGLARGGVGLARREWDGGAATAIVVVNAFGDVVDPDSGRPMLGDRAATVDRRESLLSDGDRPPPNAGLGESTTLAVVVVEGPADHRALVRCAIAAHDGFARAIRPCHTIYDGDVVFAATVAEGCLPPPALLRLTVAAELAVEQAILDAVSS